jgi:S-adenosylmethionine:tRNA ribosyltransferase-isomerase
MPVPPYILKARHENHDEIADHDDYQTIFAKNEGSVAAPTAGLHFTEELLVNLRKKGIQIEYVTLHVGLGTFQPVTSENVEDFQIHSEYYEVNSDTAERLQKAKVEGRRIIAVGTTSVRVLESSRLVAGSGETNIYIYPGYKFGFVDGIITNFHLPKSSLLLLVSAFAGQKKIVSAYEYAVKNKYRFYSYGDGMVII